ncbi:MAG: hypothetical protein Q4D91_02560 [Lautropia sp.]|nr:hypothetical protein [Lautropia sp.]
MLKHRFMTPLSATALLVLLAGCGGGDGTSGADGSTASLNSTVKTDTQAESTQGQPGDTAAQTPAGTASAEQVATQTATEAAGGIAGTLPRVTSADPGPQAVAAADEAAGNQVQAFSASVNESGTDRPIISHAEGVHGAALMTMLYQKACAEPKQTASLYGPHLSQDAYELARTFADLRYAPENYELHGWQKPLFDTVCNPNFATFRLPPSGQGSLTLSSQQHWIHDYLNRPAPKRAFHKLEANIPLSSAKWIILGKDITVNGQALTSASNGFAFQPESRIGFGVLTEWQQGEQNLRLMLLPGEQDNEAKLCWNANLDSVKRLQCTTWQAPEGWQSGQMLTVVDQYIVDDRSTYPNENGMVYLHSKQY